MTNERQCKQCGKPFSSTSPRKVYCGHDCYRKAGVKHSAAYAAAKRHPGAEKFTTREILERDGWVCKICGEPIDPNAKWVNQTGTMDHIIPIGRGGPHTRENVQAAHFICNIRKARLKPKGAGVTKPRQFRLGDDTLLQMDLIGQAMGGLNRSDVIRIAVAKLAENYQSSIDTVATVE